MFFKSEFWQYMGPALLISMGCLDPGNISGDIAVGQKAGYRLTWLLVCTSVLYYLYQSLAIKLGIYSGKDIASLCKLNYSPRWNIFLWAMAEIALLAADTQEVLGTAIALNLLFGIDIWFGVVLSLVLAFAILHSHATYGQRYFEGIFGASISIMAFCFFVNFFKVDHSISEIALGFIPFMKVEDLPFAISLLGAILMPQNLFLHSALVLTRKEMAKKSTKKNRKQKSCLLLQARNPHNSHSFLCYQLRNYWDVYHIQKRAKLDGVEGCRHRPRNDAWYSLEVHMGRGTLLVWTERDNRWRSHRPIHNGGIS
jgi:NRAMP (natural resistance-associated macrophage protein)-like metal ion transporter